MMKGDNYTITIAEGGFIVYANRAVRSEDGAAFTSSSTYNPLVFADSSALLNYLHNELVGSN